MIHLSALLEVALRSGAVYLMLLVLLRAAGKRHTAQLSPHDAVLMLLIANAVQSAMIGSNVTLWAGLVAVATLILLNVVIARLVLRNRRFAPLLAGKPTLLIHNGLIQTHALEREGILIDELEAQLRRHGYERLEQVKIAVQETDGSISVIGFGPIDERRLPRLAGATRLS
ncbi:MAG: DUF421 domain-containing protein [Polyangiaceae bacterium]|nr:DUF421 domain-containing protein [Polyangiaceae bacterium]NUQ75145.1 DUF421 domain-containing protein [Polyangiaceae bacterium]